MKYWFGLSPAAAFAAFSLLGGLAASAATIDATWTGGGSDNRWGNPDNWSIKKVPDDADGNSYRVRVSGKTCEIEIDAGQAFKTYWFFPTAGAHVTLTGSGTLNNANWTFIDEGSSMTVDGPTVTICNTLNNGVNTIKGAIYVKSGFLKNIKGSLALTDNAHVFVEGGVFGMTRESPNSNGLVISNSAELVISGGEARFQFYKVAGPNADGEKGGLLRLTGGVLQNTYDSYLYTSFIRPDARFEHTGGTIIWGLRSDFDTTHARLSSAASTGQGETFSSFLPKRGATLTIPSCTTSGALLFAVNGVYDAVGGTILVTNDSTEAAGNIRFDATSVSLLGGAEVSANALELAKSSASTQTLELTRLNLGSGGIRRTATNKSQRIDFLDGIVFGAWGDYVTTESANATLALAGPVTYETLDCFDGSTRHTVAMSRVRLAGVTDLAVTGGGSVRLAPTTSAADVRTLAVEAGTTLELTGTAPQMKAMNLRLGAGAKLKVDLSQGGFVDAAAIAEFGDGARIVVTALPATLTEKTRYPIYCAPAGTTPDLARISFAADVLPDGWSLAAIANCAYLTDGQSEPYEKERTGSTRIWSGAGADNLFATPENWVDNAAAGGAAEACFYGFHKTDIQIGAELDVRDLKVVTGGPFAFAGERIRFQYPSSPFGSQPSVWNYTEFPVVVSDPVQAYYATNSVWALGFDQGGVSLVGGSSRKHLFRFGGDVRVGGAWEMQSVWIAPTYSSTAKRTSRLTVLPGATVTVSDQARDVNEKGAGAFSVAQGGALTFNGTNLTFSTANTHFVDGTLTVNCPLLASARQTFRGDGTLSLPCGFATSDAGDIRVEGDLTLVPSNLVDEVTLSVKDNVTIAPAENWTYGGAATLELEGHSALTFAVDGVKATLAKPLVSDGALVAKGAGRLVLGASGMRLGRVSCADGAKIALAEGIGSATSFTDILTVREPDDSIAFADGLDVVSRVDPATGATVYAAKLIRGFVIIAR